MKNDAAYDIAISFLVVDEAVARALADKLEASGLRVFFFPHRQEELAGTNGMESMREPFFNSRQVVVFFREPWGATPWTGVEQTAITERCLKLGWGSLLFVQLDKASPLPKWLPETHVRFAFEDYGLEQLVGAVKLRVQEQGGEIRPPNAMTTARRVQREAELIRKRAELFGDRRWIESTVHTSIRKTFESLIALADKAKVELGLAIVAGSDDYKVCVLRSERVSVSVGWRQAFFNTIADECSLCVREFSGGLLLPGEQGYFIHKPKLLKEHHFKVDLSDTFDLVWTTGIESRITENQLPDRIMIIFLDLISRSNNGKIRPPGDLY